jgi:hypothetical protein
MRTALISDLHLGSTSREDVLRDPSIRHALLEEIEGADRVVLLGDTVEMRNQPLGAALEAARPFFEELGEVIAPGQVLMLAGNHDHRLADPLLDRHPAGGGPPLGLEARYGPESGPTALIAGWLGRAQLELSYPGAWLRDDVFAMHGHYMDCHLTLPRGECIGSAVVARATRPLPDPASPEDYERLLRPLYGLAFGLAQSGDPDASDGLPGPEERAWKWLFGDSGHSRRRRIAAAVISRGAVPAATWTLNRVLRTEFEPDLSAAAITSAGIAGMSEAARRLRIEADHVIVGHSHRAGPGEGEAAWPLAGGGQLHNTGNWIFASAFHRPDSTPGPYWPGTVTWLEGDEPPRRVSLLAQRSAEELARIAGHSFGHFRLAALASSEVG